MKKILIVEDSTEINNMVCNFYKNDVARTSSSTGLGLSIAKELLNRMHGDIFAIVENNIFKIIVKLQIFV